MCMNLYIHAHLENYHSIVNQLYFHFKKMLLIDFFKKISYWFQKGLVMTLRLCKALLPWGVINVHFMLESPKIALVKWDVTLPTHFHIINL